MDDTNNLAATPEVSALAISQFCPRDGDVLYAGIKTIIAGGNTYNYNAWLCPTCTYWKLRTVAAS